MSTPRGDKITEYQSPLHDNTNAGKKRTHDESISSDPKSLPCQPELVEFSLTAPRPTSRDSGTSKDNVHTSAAEWQTVEGRPKKKAKKIPKSDSKNYPAIEFSKECRLQSQIKISDLQNLILYILADGTSPQFVSVKHRPEIRKIVVLMVPGLEMSMFRIGSRNLEKKNDQHHRDGAHRDNNSKSPDDYYPKRLRSEDLPESVRQFADMFDYVWPVKTPGDDKYGKMHSPLHAILTAPMQKTKEEKNWNKTKKGATPAKEPQGWRNNRVPIPELIHTVEELLENEYTLHPASYSNETERSYLAEIRQSQGVSIHQGWVDTLVKDFNDGTPPNEEIEAGSITAGREVLAMDCEMCMVGEKEFVLTRISIVGWDGTTVLDELVKPDRPITNYLTQ
jgi:RNA exonuclease 1